MWLQNDSLLNHGLWDRVVDPIFSRTCGRQGGRPATHRKPSVVASGERESHSGRFALIVQRAVEATAVSDFPFPDGL
jgi:hypothetical protein